MSVSVRLAQRGDGAAIARIYRGNAAYYLDLLGRDFRLPDEEGLVEFCEPGSEENSETAVALVALVDDEVAGYLEAQLQPPLESARWQSNPDLAEPRLFINVVTVGKEFWRRGAASALVEAAEDWGRERGARVATCDTHIDSPVSMPFWRDRAGYRPRGVIFRKEL